MPSRYHGLLLVIFLTLFQDMGNASPIRSRRSLNRPWDMIKQQTRNLNNLALKLYNTSEAMKDMVLDGIPRIQCHHHCGPQHLASNKETCLKRIFHILSYYRSMLSNLSMGALEASQKKEDIYAIKDIISRLLLSLQVNGYEDKNVTAPQNVTDEFVLNNIGFPLVSATNIIARVFTPGDPAYHERH